MDELLEIIPQTLPEDQRRILDLVGPEIYAKLVEAYGGLTIYIPKKDSFLRTARNEEIRRKFNGTNYRSLATEHNLSEVAIRQIVADIDHQMRTQQIDGQEDLFQASL